jgi:hypothetical protein
MTGIAMASAASGAGIPDSAAMSRRASQDRATYSTAARADHGLR